MCLEVGIQVLLLRCYQVYVILTLPPDDDFCMTLSYRYTRTFGCSHDQFSLIMDVALILCRLSSLLIPLVQEKEECSLYSVSAQACRHTTTHAQYERHIHNASVKRCDMHLCYIRTYMYSHVCACIYVYMIVESELL